jgi:hypothetical protein
MWAAETTAKIDIPLGIDVTEWTNSEFEIFIRSKRTKCSEFDKALNWLGRRSYNEAIRDCENKQWLDWLKTNLPTGKEIIKTGTKITITKGRNEKYALWHNSIWDLPKEYVNEGDITILSAS